MQEKMEMKEIVKREDNLGNNSLIKQRKHTHSLQTVCEYNEIKNIDLYMSTQQGIGTLCESVKYKDTHTHNIKSEIFALIRHFNKRGRLKRRQE